MANGLGNCVVYSGPASNSSLLSSKRTLPAVVSRLLVASPGGDVLRRVKGFGDTVLGVVVSSVSSSSIGFRALKDRFAFLLSLRRADNFVSSILIMGIVGTEVVILMKWGSEMFLSLSALMTFDDGAVRSDCVGGGVSDSGIGPVGCIVELGETLGGGVFGKMAVEGISGVIYLISVVIGVILLASEFDRDRVDTEALRARFE
jgi:hypothetical protein